MGKKVTKDAKVVRVNKNKPQPELLSIENHSNQPESISIGDLLTLKGERLLFSKSDLNVGLFFIKRGVAIRVSEYSQVSHKKISFKIPLELTKGSSYKLVARVRIGEEMREGEFSDNLKIT